MNLFDIKIGTEIGFVYGPGEFPQENKGKVIEKVENQWDKFLRIEMDNGNIEYVHSLTTKGIGAYLLS